MRCLAVPYRNGGSSSESIDKPLASLSPRALFPSQRVVPDALTLQNGDKRSDWIKYSALDAQATYMIRVALESKLRNLDVRQCKFLRSDEAVHKAEAAHAGVMAEAMRQAAPAVEAAGRRAYEAAVAEGLGAERAEAARAAAAAKAAAAARSKADVKSLAADRADAAADASPRCAHLCNSMWDLYTQYWRGFGHLLTELEHRGMRVDRGKLREAEASAVSDQEQKEAQFREWASKLCEGARYMNVGSGVQARGFPSLSLPFRALFSFLLTCRRCAARALKTLNIVVASE